MVMLAIEEMRVKTIRLEASIKEFTDAVLGRVARVETEVGSKMATRDADRVLECMHRKIVTLQRSVDVVCDGLAANVDRLCAERREGARSAADAPPGLPLANFTARGYVRQEPRALGPKLRGAPARPLSAVSTPGARSRRHSPGQGPKPAPKVQQPQAPERLRLASSNIVSPRG